MKPPPELWIWLVDSWPIDRIRVKRIVFDGDREALDCTIGGAIGERTVRWDALQALIRLVVDYHSIAHPLHHVQDAVKKWREFEKQHEADLKEFARLKEKLGQ